MEHTNTAANASGIGLMRSTIRDIFMKHGFTIKEGQSDLKPYVYAAADELIALARVAPQHPGSFLLRHLLALRSTLANDQYAATFTSIDAYRAALLSAFDGAAVASGEATAPQHSVTEQDECHTLETARHMEGKRADFEATFKIDIWAVQSWLNLNGFEPPKKYVRRAQPLTSTQPEQASEWTLPSADDVVAEIERRRDGATFYFDTPRGAVERALAAIKTLRAQPLTSTQPKQASEWTLPSAERAGWMPAFVRFTSAILSGHASPQHPDKAALQAIAGLYGEALPADAAPQHSVTNQAQPIAYVNGDELDNMLDDRTAIIQGTPSGWRKTPLYAHPLVTTAAAQPERASEHRLIETVWKPYVARLEQEIEVAKRGNAMLLAENDRLSAISAPNARYEAQHRHENGPLMDWKPLDVDSDEEADRRMDYGALGNWRKVAPASATRCDTCKGCGCVCVGSSGQESDGNAPILEPCPECAYGASTATSVSTVTWKGHDLRILVNDLRAIAESFSGTQQLRARISDRVARFLETLTISESTLTKGETA